MKWFKKRQKQPLSCDIALIVYNTVLLHTKHKNIVAHGQESLLKFTATELAEAARRLLPLTTKRYKIALALPSAEFVATCLTLPAAAAAQNLKNVVNLQKPNLLPGMTEQLLLAVQAPTEGEHICALWMTVKRAEELFQAFDKVDLFLSCILPRSVILLPETKIPSQIYDEDDNTITCIQCSDGIIQRWLPIPKIDYEEAEFRQQLDEALSDDIKSIRKTHIEDWETLSTPSSRAYHYAFTPPACYHKTKVFNNVFIARFIKKIYQ